MHAVTIVPRRAGTLERLITRMIPLDRFEDAYTKVPDDVKTVIVFEN